MKKRIIICADGTWNDPDQTDKRGIRKPSNVVKMARAVLPITKDGICQVVFYDQFNKDSLGHDVCGVHGQGLF